MRWIPLLLLTVLPVASQDAIPVDDAAAISPWMHKLVGDVTANQVALKDWSQGGDDSFSWGYRTTPSPGGTV